MFNNAMMMSNGDSGPTLEVVYQPDIVLGSSSFNFSFPSEVKVGDLILIHTYMCGQEDSSNKGFTYSDNHTIPGAFIRNRAAGSPDNNDNGFHRYCSVGGAIVTQAMLDAPQSFSKGSQATISIHDMVVLKGPVKSIISVNDIYTNVATTNPINRNKTLNQGVDVTQVILSSSGTYNSTINNAIFSGDIPNDTINTNAPSPYSTAFQYKTYLNGEAIGKSISTGVNYVSNRKAATHISCVLELEI